MPFEFCAELSCPLGEKLPRESELLFLKQSEQYTGLPPDGLNGILHCFPHLLHSASCISLSPSPNPLLSLPNLSPDLLSPPNPLELPPNLLPPERLSLLNPPLLLFPDLNDPI